MKIDTEILCSYIDGELDSASAAAVRAALETDDNLRREYDDLRKTAELVRALPKVSAPPEILAGITANAEREQLLGITGPSPKRRTGLYWGLSVAASLLIGVGLGALGYHGLQSGEPGFGGGSIPIMIAKDNSGTVLRSRELDVPAVSTDGLASLGKSVPTGILYRGKGGPRISRSGPPSGVSAKSGRMPGEGEIAVRGRPANATMKVGMPGAEQDQQQLALAEEEAFADDLEMRVNAKGALPIPLGAQMVANNFVNQDMAVNLRFEAEPLNVNVVSNDTKKTLRYVQKWAVSNSLVDLNKASPEMNFPVYTQVVYQGKPGSNIAAVNQNGILLRTTRHQARQIVAELQSQKPLVVSVAVKDKKNTLGLDAKQLDERETGLAVGSTFGVDQKQEVLAEQQAADVAAASAPVQAGVAMKSQLGDRSDIAGEAVAGRQSSQIATTPPLAANVPLPAGGERAGAEYYFSQINNQMQFSSLEDLVTLVVMVTDARVPQITSPPAGVPGAGESE